MFKKIQFVCALTALTVFGGAGFLFGAGLGYPPASVMDVENWQWICHCQTLHTAYKAAYGDTGIVCHFGDSITYANQYGVWADRSGGPGFTAADTLVTQWMHVGGPGDPNPVSPYSLPANCATITGWWQKDGFSLQRVDMTYDGSYTAMSGITTDQYLNGTDNLPVPSAMINCFNPEIIVILLGTNDAKTAVPVATMQANLNSIVQECMAKNGIPILTTLPPSCAGFDVTNYNTAIMTVAQNNQIPVIGFNQAIMFEQPGGTETAGPWSSTLISADCIHPSGTDASSDPTANNYADLQQGGYLLRTWLTIKKIEEVYANCVTGTACGASTNTATATPGLPANTATATNTATFTPPPPGSTNTNTFTETATPIPPTPIPTPIPPTPVPTNTLTPTVTAAGPTSTNTATFTISYTPTITDTPTTVPTPPQQTYSYPNPIDFNKYNYVTIAFPAEPDNNVTIYVVNIAGETVATVPLASIHATEGWARWDGKDSSGKIVATGMYFYFVRSSHMRMRQKLTLIN